VQDVVAADQAVAGAQVQVRYTVTNLGSGATTGDTWTDAVWLTRDKIRPHPSHGDILLATLTHTGSPPRFRRHDPPVSVRIPAELASGQWYITPWTDPYDVIPEDTLSGNVNPDDPNQVDNNNYKARPITILGALPDLIVTQVQAPATFLAGGSYTVT